jgi:hypothetical protein
MTKAKTTDRSHVTRTRSVTKDHRGVVVGSEVGVTLPIGDTTAHLRFSFWHERIAKSDSQEEILRTVNLVDEFNEEELNRRVPKYRRLIARMLNEEDDDDEPKKKDSDVQARARKRMKKGKKK